MELLEQPLQRKKNVNIKKEIGRYLKKWPWILLSMMLFFIAAKLYLRYTTPQYLTKSTIKIEGLKGDATLSQFQNLGTNSPLITKAGASEEIPIILSRPILYDVVKNLNIDVSVKREGSIKDQELYGNSPVDIKILSLKNNENFNSSSYVFEPRGKLSFTLIDANGKKTTYQYNKVANADFGTFILKPKPGFTLSKLNIIFFNAEKIAAQLGNNILIEQNALNSAILELNHTDEIPDKSTAILNNLIIEYNESDLENKKLQSKVSLDFIDERLDMLTEDLGSIENQKEGFKRANQITDLETQAQLSLQSANENTKQILEQATQLEMINSVLSIANRSSNEDLLPTNIGVPSALNQIISEYNNLVLTRNKSLRQATTSNPAIIELDKEIRTTRSLIRDNLRKSQQSIQQTISQLNGQLNTSKQNISKFPTQEKIFRNIDRQQNLKESLYLFLLQKKEETSIAMAVTMPKVRVINPAYSLAGPVEPKSQQILLGSLLLGFLIPLLVLYGIFTLDTQVKSKKDITEALPDVPVIAEIPSVGKDDSDLIGQNDLSVYAEAFRILTSNLKFILKKKSHKSPVILFTSSVKGEGKTTVSINSALALATNKKVVLIGADLRNPQLGRYVEKNVLGLSDYLANETSKITDFIFSSSQSKNLDIVQSGSIPPNPTDLLEDARFGQMLDELKELYDYILIDSAPLMMVSDTFHTLRFADALVYVVRANYTEKELLEYAEGVSKDENVKNMAIVLNDVSKEEIRYGYGGKYSYGYHAEKENKGWFNFLRRN